MTCVEPVQDRDNNFGGEISWGYVGGSVSNHNPLDFIQADLVIRAVVELRRASGFVGRNVGGALDCATAKQVGSYTCCPERVVAQGIAEPDLSCTAFDHSQSVVWVHASGSQLALPAERAKERR